MALLEGTVDFRNKWLDLVGSLVWTFNPRECVRTFDTSMVCIRIRTRRTTDWRFTVMFGHFLIQYSNSSIFAIQCFTHDPEYTFSVDAYLIPSPSASKHVCNIARLPMYFYEPINIRMQRTKTTIFQVATWFAWGERGRKTGISRNLSY